MVIVIITGATHTGKTCAAQKLLEKYHIPYLSLDLLKMGLIRSKNTTLTPYDDEELTSYLWGIAKEMIKTAIENDQHLIVEGCYVPFDWAKDFGEEYLPKIRCFCLVMSEKYIRTHFEDIRRYENEVEHRLFDDLNMEELLSENKKYLEGCKQAGQKYILIDENYDFEINLTE